MARKTVADSGSKPHYYQPPSWQEKDPTPPTPFQLALRDVFKMACDGASPEACAVVYRSLDKQYPGRAWLLTYASEWAALGENWLGPNAPKRGNVGRQSVINFTTATEADLMAEAERQLERAKAAGWL